MLDRIEHFAIGPNGARIGRVTIRGGGLTARILTWGATVQSLYREGSPQSLLLGSPDIFAYFAQMRYFSAVVGPVANRIAGGRFTLGEAVYETERNESGVTTLHGGFSGFAERPWRVIDFGDSYCTMETSQPDGFGGFPGPINVCVTYGLTDDGALSVQISGTSEVSSVFAPAFHGYWNLSGSTDLLDHLLRISADRYLPVDERQIPTGVASDVEGTPFDYRMAKTPDPDLDHNFCLSDVREPLRDVAEVKAGRLSLCVQTTEPGLQVYSGGRTSSGRWPGHGGKPYGLNAGLALEPQAWPNAVNRPDFPSVRLSPGETVTQLSRFVISERDS